MIITATVKQLVVMGFLFLLSILTVFASSGCYAQETSPVARANSMGSEAPLPSAAQSAPGDQAVQDLQQRVTALEEQLETLEITLP